MGAAVSDCFDHMTDAWDDCLFGATAHGYRGEGYAPRSPRCKFCGSTDVKWRLLESGWRLYNTERQLPGNLMLPHACRSVANVDEFEVLC